MFDADDLNDLTNFILLFSGFCFVFPAMLWLLNVEWSASELIRSKEVLAVCGLNFLMAIAAAAWLRKRRLILQ